MQKVSHHLCILHVRESPDRFIGWHGFFNALNHETDLHKTFQPMADRARKPSKTFIPWTSLLTGPGMILSCAVTL